MRQPQAHPAAEQIRDHDSDTGGSGHARQNLFSLGIGEMVEKERVDGEVAGGAALGQRVVHSKRDARDTPRIGHALGAGHCPGADVDPRHLRAHAPGQAALELPRQGHGDIPAAAGHIDDPQRPRPLDATREL